MALRLPPIALNIQATTLPEIQMIVGFLQVWNAYVMSERIKAGVPVPHPYDTKAIYYRPSPGEARFRTYEEIIRDGIGTCSDWAPYLAAYMNVHGHRAHAEVIESPAGAHVRVKLGDGTIEDPARVKGMKVF